ncbi:Eukaryotic translation initiation factor 3 subunit G [Salinomyces thailandicus]|uniref:Eukaryotic translation initiation factor 3 subunit G n=1 Tax=Salinomyces thailandicus TaxID=706561 RepID=A0A4U0U8F6_9PEZI|nr:Eukaryotic translation initiation factor 3 subunit G [Salinomyces thailandica]
MSRSFEAFSQLYLMLICFEKALVIVCGHKTFIGAAIADFLISSEPWDIKFVSTYNDRQPTRIQDNTIHDTESSTTRTKTRATMAAAVQNNLGRTDWAEDDEPDLATAMPAPQTSKNKDGSETIVTFFINEEGKKVKRTQRIRRTVIKKKENPRVAERRAWSKIGPEAGKPPGPRSETTTLGENIVFRPTMGYKSGQAQETTPQEDKKADALKKMQIKCRICSGDHFTTKCPFKDTMAPEGEAAGPPADLEDGVAGDTAGQLGTGGGGYVPPHLRKGGAGAGERMGGKYERDDLATLRVTNVSEIAEEQDLRGIFERYGRVTRVFLAKDRETGRAKGFAFVSFGDRTDAANACEMADGFGLHHLILKVEFAKKST